MRIGFYWVPFTRHILHMILLWKRSELVLFEAVCRPLTIESPTRGASPVSKLRLAAFGHQKDWPSLYLQPAGKKRHPLLLADGIKGRVQSPAGCTEFICPKRHETPPPLGASSNRSGSVELPGKHLETQSQHKSQTLLRV